MSHTHSHAQPPDTNKARKQATQRVTLVGGIVNLLLSAAQIVGGFISGSQALIADGFHTLSDLLSDVVVIVAAQHAHKDADDNHPYGHGRIETVATVMLGLMLAGVAVGIFLQAWDRLFADEPFTAPQMIGLAFAALAILAKEGLYHYTLRTARRFQSKLLEANAWHHRSDAISSIVVFVGITGAQLGWPWLDSIAAMVVACLILYMAGRMILDSTLELVDTGVEPERAAEITQFIADLDGVQSVHMLRTRHMGSDVFADAHIEVASGISVSEGHRIAEYVMQRLRQAFPDIADVTVHIDPEDDEVVKPSADLPIRSELLAQLHAQATTEAFWDSIQKILIHYIDGQIQLEIFLDETASAAAAKDFEHACQQLSVISGLRFYQLYAPK